MTELKVRDIIEQLYNDNLYNYGIDALRIIKRYLDGAYDYYTMIDKLIDARYHLSVVIPILDAIGDVYDDEELDYLEDYDN